MGDEGIFATTAEVQHKVGAGANSTSNSELFINDFMAQAESFINSVTRKNWSNVYGTLNEETRDILKRAASSFAAIMVIQYDMSGYSSLAEAQTMLDVLRDEAFQCIGLLRDQEVKTFNEKA